MWYPTIVADSHAPPQTPGLDPSLSDKPVLENKVRVWSIVCCYQKISVPIKLSYENSYRSSDAWFLHFFKLLVKIRITAICNVATEQFWNRDRNFKWRIASRETIDSTVDWFPRLKDPDVTTIWRFQTGLRTATYGGEVSFRRPYIPNFLFASILPRMVWVVALKLTLSQGAENPMYATECRVPKRKYHEIFR